MKTKIFTILAAILCLCALFAVAVSAEGTPETDIVAHNLALNDSVDIKYYVDFQNVPEGAEKGVLIWTSVQDEYIYGTQKAKIENNIEIYDDYLVYKFTGIAAKMMSQDIYAKSYIKVGDEITYGPLDKYSVLQYCYNKKGSTTTVTGGTKTLGELVEKMLEYGAWAQEYFNYNTDRMANATYYTVDVVNGTLADGTTSGLYVSGETTTLVTDIAKFDHWENSNGENVGNTATLNITVTEDETYSAVAGIYSKGLEFTSNGDGTCYVSGIGTCTDINVVIPIISETGDAVAGIGASAFENCTTLETVYISEGVTQIGEKAFLGCTDLVTVDIADSVTLIKYHAFKDCSALENINFSKNSKLDGIEYAAFSSCISLKTFELPGSVTWIGNYLFTSCTSLESITVAEGSKDFEVKGNCLIEDGECLRAGCINSVIPDDGSITSIFVGAFNGQHGFKNKDVVIPSSVKSIHTDAFDGSEMRSLTFAADSQLTTIGSYAFNVCGNLVTLELPNSLTSIGDSAFARCYSLTSITIPDSVESIGTWAFYCSPLTTINYNGTEEQWDAIEKGTNWDKNAGDYELIFQQVTVTFKDWNGTVLKSQDIQVGASATAPNNPTRFGYRFIGWDKTFNNITVNTTVTAQYIQQLTVTFKNWDGTTLKTQTVDFGSAATAPADPERNGYTFNGWDNDYTNVLADIIVTAKWTANNYTVTLDKQGGSGGTASVTAIYAAAMQNITVPTRTGYTFGGYYDEKNGSGTQYYDSNGICVKNWDKTVVAKLYAKWTVETYVLNFNKNDSAAISGRVSGSANDTSVLFGQTAKLPILSCDYCTFNGWLIGSSTIPVMDWTVIDIGNSGDSITAEASWTRNFTPITTATELSDIRNNYDETYVLMNDINLSGFEWISISDFSGIIDGNGHKIIELNGTLISKITNSGEIRNICFDNSSYSYAADYSGGGSVKRGIVCNYNVGNITNVNVTNSSLNITLNTTNIGSIQIYLGFICAENNGLICSCNISKATIYFAITANGFPYLDTNGETYYYSCYVGSIVGSNNGEVNSCVIGNNVSVTGLIHQCGQNAYHALAGGQNDLTISGDYYLGSYVGINNNNNEIVNCSKASDFNINMSVHQLVCYNTGFLGAASEWKTINNQSNQFNKYSIHYSNYSN